MAAVVALFACAQLFPATTSSFTDTTATSGNTISAAADWTGPTVDAVVVQKSEGGAVSKTRPNGQFHVYATVGDTDGATVSASVDNVATVSTAAMTAGSWTIGGTTYNFRTELLTAKSTLTTGSSTVTVTATDGTNTPSSLDHTVAFNDTTFSGTDFSWDDAGSTIGRFQPGEVVRFIYNREIEPGSLQTDWDGSSTGMNVMLLDASIYGTGTDILALIDTAGTTQIPVGVAYLNGDYVASGKTLTFTGSTMALDGNAVEATLGTWDVAANARTITVTAAPTWAPGATAYDTFGITASTTAPTAFAPSVFTATNKSGGTTGTAQVGDTIGFDFTKTPSTDSVLSGWDGSATSVTVRITDKSAAGTASDRLTVHDDQGQELPLGRVLLIGDYVLSGLTVNFTNSSMTLVGDVVRITLGTPGVGTRRDTGTRRPSWTPGAGLLSSTGGDITRFAAVPATALTLF